MKDIILTILAAATLFASGCRNFMYSHNANQILDGKFTRFGVGDYGLVHGQGLILTQAVRENTVLVIETTDGNSFSGEPSAKIDGVRRICIKTGPQVTGYLVDLAKSDPGTANGYVEAMPRLYAPNAEEKKDNEKETENKEK